MAKLMKKTMDIMAEGIDSLKNIKKTRQNTRHS